MQTGSKKELVVRRISAAQFEVIDGTPLPKEQEEEKQQQNEEQRQQEEQQQWQEQQQRQEQQWQEQQQRQEQQWQEQQQRQDQQWQEQQQRQDQTPQRKSVIERAPPAAGRRREGDKGSEGVAPKRGKVEGSPTGVILIREAIMYRIVDILMWKVLGEKQLKGFGYPSAPTQEVLWRIVHRNWCLQDGRKLSAESLPQDHDCRGSVHCFASHVYQFLDIYAPNLWRRTGWGKLSCEEVLRKIYYEDLIPYLRAVDLRNSLGVLQSHSDIVLLEKWEKQKFTAVTWSGQKYISQMPLDCPRCPQCRNRHF